VSGDAPEPNGPSTPKDAPRRKKRRFGLSIWFMLLVIGAALLLQNLLDTREEMSYSEFKALLEDEGQRGRIEKIEVSDERIRARIRPEGEAEGDAEAIEHEIIRVNPDEKFVDLLRDSGVAHGGVTEGTGFLTLFMGYVLPILLIGGFLIFILRRMGPSQSVMSFGKSRAKIYADEETGFSFDDVAGVDEAVEEVREIVEFLREPEKFQALGARIPKGVLLLGAPGTGKTLLARAVAGEAHVAFFSLSGSDFVEMFVGVGASRVRDLFQQAQQRSPCIVFIDELDALGKTRGAGGSGGNDEREQTLNQLLVEMDGFDTNSGVIIMGATNRPEILDRALLRPGRFDRQIVVDRPDINGREQILIVHARKVRLADDVELRTIAARTPGFVGADLANVVNEAALLAARRGRDSVSESDLEEAIDRVIAGLEKKKRLMNPKEKEIVAYHECGHALVASMLPGTNPVHRISIIPRGLAALGHTLQLPTEDRYLMTANELKNEICTLLGGRMAEQIVFSDVSTGAQNDLERATDIARRMVQEYGMSERLGPVNFAERTRSFLAEHPEARDFSDETAREIDQEVRRIIGAAADRTRKILSENQPKLETLAKLLVEKEVVEREELEAVIAGEKPPATNETDADGEG
jgi:cell division protease FtsH